MRETLTKKKTLKILRRNSRKRQEKVQGLWRKRRIDEDLSIKVELTQNHLVKHSKHLIFVLLDERV